MSVRNIIYRKEPVATATPVKGGRATTGLQALQAHRKHFKGNGWPDPAQVRRCADKVGGGAGKGAGLVALG